jgi:hypothetical protein
MQITMHALRMDHLPLHGDNGKELAQAQLGRLV